MQLLADVAPPLSPTDIVWRDSSRLSVTFVLTNALPGDRKLRVLNDNGTETITGAFIKIR